MYNQTHSIIVKRRTNVRITKRSYTLLKLIYWQYLLTYVTKSKVNNTYEYHEI